MMQLLTAEDCSIVNTFQDVVVYFRTGICPSLLATLLETCPFPAHTNKSRRL
jgi:hypothetical protein